MTYVEQLDHAKAASATRRNEHDDPVILILDEWRADLQTDPRPPIKPHQRLWRTAASTGSAELLLAFAALIWGVLLVTSPHLYEHAVGLYAGNAAIMPEWMWGAPLLISSGLILLGIATRRPSARSFGLLIQTTIWTLAAIAQLDAASISGTPAMFALGSLFVYLVHPRE